MEAPTIDCKGGIVEINDLPYLFTDKGIDPSYLKEDMFFVIHRDRAVDVGFYGDHKLKIVIIEGEDWENPVYVKKIKRRAIKKDIVFAEVNKAIALLETL